jgi:predicted KAP-like P-loop ATPase
MQHPFNPDTPITLKSADQLNRATFAEKIANAIRNWNHKPSFVMALWGDWGTGKTSLKNMILEDLAKTKDGTEPIQTISFNPWQINNQEALTTIFLHEIGHALGQQRASESREKAKQRAKAWNTFAFYLGIVGSLSTTIQSQSPALATALTQDPTTTALIATVATTLIDNARKSIERRAKISETAAADNVPSLDHLRKETAKHLESLPQPILIVLDDIDRLTDDEIRHIFQLIKATADFPNLFYMLLGHRQYIVNALQRLTIEHPDQYLEKIVQVEIHIPHLRPEHIFKVVTEGLKAILEDPSVSKTFDQSRWDEHIWPNGVSKFFTNLREANRYLSSLRFHVGVFKSENAFEVNATDLFALEAIRVFAPDAYTYLRTQKQILVLNALFTPEEATSQAAALLQRIYTKAPSQGQEPVRNILRALFPAFDIDQIRSLADPEYYANLHITSHHLFDLYFTFEHDKSALSETQYEAALLAINEASSPESVFDELEQQKLLDEFLEKLLSKGSPLDSRRPEAVLTAIAATLKGPSVDRNRYPSRRYLITNVIVTYVTTLKGSELSRTLLSIIDSRFDYYLNMQILQFLEKKSRSAANRPAALFNLFNDQEALAPILSSITHRIQHESTQPNFADHPKLDQILAQWRIWDPTSAGEWLKNNLHDTTYSAARFLDVFVSPSSNPNAQMIQWKLEQLADIVSPQKLRGLLGDLPQAHLTEQDLNNIRYFQAAIPLDANPE